MASGSEKSREPTFAHLMDYSPSAFDYGAEAAQSREEAVAGESVALSFLTWIAVVCFAIWFCLWLAGCFGRVVAAVIR
jgi:hypothetical protein